MDGNVKTKYLPILLVYDGEKDRSYKEEQDMAR